MEEELKFPLEFKTCPNCGSTRRVAGTIAEQEREKGKISKEVQACIKQVTCIIADPRMVTLQAPAIIAFVDICADCGTMYCIRAQLGTATPSSPSGKGPGMKDFGLPQNEPRWS